MGETVRFLVSVPDLDGPPWARDAGLLPACVVWASASVGVVVLASRCDGVCRVAWPVSNWRGSAWAVAAIGA